MKKIKLYTDGACSGNPGNGGWGYLLQYKNVQKENFGGLPQTTNNQMELTAVIEGLKALKESCIIDGYTGDKICRYCNTEIAKGLVIPAIGTHDYSEIPFIYL